MRKFDSRHFRWWWERLNRGFDERETWCLTTTLLKFTLPRLQAFPQGGQAPGSFILNEDGSEKPIEEACEAWNAALNKMIRAIEIWLDNEGHPPEEQEAEVEEGMDLFFEHFFDLWW